MGRKDWQARRGRVDGLLEDTEVFWMASTGVGWMGGGKHQGDEVSGLGSLKEAGEGARLPRSAVCGLPVQAGVV